MELTVVIPTRDRNGLLRETLRRLGEQSAEARFEVIVVDDGSRDGSPEAVREIAARAELDIRLFEQASLGPAVARNRAIEAARAPACLFLNDDTWPRPGVVARHASFHRDRPEQEAALLGNVALPSHPSPSPFMRWLAAQHFDFSAIEDRDDVGGGRFFTANVSAKVDLVRAAGGFDESFAHAAHEDIELGMRLQKHGMRLRYDPDSVVEHCHPLDLDSALARFHGIGGSLAALAARHPEYPVPRRPGARHRVKAAALTTITALGVRPRALQREVWRFLCHEAVREAYWRAVEGAEHDRGVKAELQIGRRLHRQALRDLDTRLPAEPAGSPR